MTTNEMIENLAGWLSRNVDHKNFEKNLLLYEAMHKPYSWEGEEFYVCIDKDGDIDRVVFKNKVSYTWEEIESLQGVSKDMVIKAHKVKTIMREGSKQSIIQGESQCVKSQMKLL